MVISHVLVTLFEIMISIVIPISRTLVFTNVTFAVQSALDRIVIAYVGFPVQRKTKKLETKMLLKISARNWTKVILPLVSASLAVL